MKKFKITGTQTKSQIAFCEKMQEEMERIYAIKYSTNIYISQKIPYLAYHTADLAFGLARVKSREEMLDEETNNKDSLLIEHFPIQENIDKFFTDTTVIKQLSENEILDLFIVLNRDVGDENEIKNLEDIVYKYLSVNKKLEKTDFLIVNVEIYTLTFSFRIGKKYYDEIIEKELTSPFYMCSLERVSWFIEKEGKMSLH